MSLWETHFLEISPPVDTFPGNVSLGDTFPGNLFAVASTARILRNKSTKGSYLFCLHQTTPRGCVPLRAELNVQSPTPPTTHTQNAYTNRKETSFCYGRCGEDNSLTSFWVSSGVKGGRGVHSLSPFGSQVAPRSEMVIFTSLSINSSTNLSII